MPYYNIRDLLGHFTKGRGGKKCPHKCCRGRRPHPKQKALIPDRAVLRAMSDDELARRVDWDDPKSVKTFIGEAERRDRERERRAREKNKREAVSAEYHLFFENVFDHAEDVTRGNMLSKAGKAARVHPRTLWTGSERTARKYASEELREYWDKHGRLTITEYRRQAAKEKSALADEDERAQRKKLYGVY